MTGPSPTLESANPVVGSPPLNRRHGRKPIGIAVAAVVVVAILLLSLLFLGLVPGWRHTSSSGSPGPLDYTGARALADSAAGGVPGGPWSSVYAEGSVTGNASAGVPGAYNCVVNSMPGFQSLTPSRPAPVAGGSWTSGKAPWWFFVYSNGTGILGVVVSNGSGVALGTKSNQYDTCFVNPPTIPATGILNSTTAFSDLAASNSSFFGHSPNLNGTMELYWGLVDNNTRLWPVWTATLTTCTSFNWYHTATYLNGTTFHELLNATSGAIISGTEYGGPTVCHGPTGPQ